MSTQIAPVIISAANKLTANGKNYLFAGVTMGDEQTLFNYSYVDSVDVALGSFMADRGAAKIPIGFNALTQNGYTLNNPPADFAVALAQVNHDFVSYCCMLLNAAGIPPGKIYTHIAAAAGYPESTLLRYSNAPLSTAFNNYSTPGFTTYIIHQAPNDLSEINAELVKQKISNWGATESNPNISGGLSPADYIKMHFDHGASVMVLNAGATSASLSNELYQGVYGVDAVNAYYSFLANK